MEKTPEELARVWLKQGQRHLGSCEVMLEISHFDQVCFQAQQAAATSLASLVFLAGGRPENTPSCIRLLGRLGNQYPSLADYKESAGLLDQVYTTSRYPDDELEVAPDELFGRSQAEDLLARAQAIVEEAGHVIDRASRAPSP